MPSAKRLILQILNYAVFMGLVWYFSFMPSYVRLAPDESMITLSLSHAGELVEECRRMSQEEMAKLPPNMRVPMECPRERSPVSIEVLLDDKPVITEVVDPPGLYKDQGVDIYQSVRIPAGDYRLEVRMNDSVRAEGLTHRHEQSISLVPAQLLVIQFHSSTGDFVIR